MDKFREHVHKGGKRKNPNEPGEEGEKEGGRGNQGYKYEGSGEVKEEKLAVSIV